MLSSDIVFWICVFVGLTVLPMMVDLVRIFFPSYAGRGGGPRPCFGGLIAAHCLVAAWHWQRPLLVAIIVFLCVWAYYVFWVSILPYSTEAFTTAWCMHIVGISALWINSVWNYVVCATIDPGFVRKHEGDGCETGTLLEQTEDGVMRCRCGQHVIHLDHHCPFTGGCIGANNFRFFMLFLLHCSLGCTYASYLAWPPFADCVLRQCNFPLLGLVPNVYVPTACKAMGSRTLLLLPAFALAFTLGWLGVVHAWLLANGLTTIQYVRRARCARAAGPAASLRTLREFLFVQGRIETDKWRLLWGRPASSATRLHCARLLLLPSLPERRVLRHGQGSSSSWITFGAVEGLVQLGLVKAAADGAGVSRRV